MNIAFKMILFSLPLPPMVKFFNLIKAERTCKSAEPSTASQMFLSIPNNRRLKENIMSESRVRTWLHCGAGCLETRFCVAYNHKENSKENETNCQLSHTADHNFDIVSTDENDWTFYKAVGERKSDCRKKNECQNTGTAVWDPVKPFKCNCLECYEGELCEKSKSKGKSCLEIKKNSPHPFVSSGVYCIKPDNGSSSPHVKVYCDMETHSGGWTLVYSYTFTNYDNFNDASNAVTPRPNWPAPTANVPISTTPPLSEASRGAVDYNLWKYIGNDVMIKSNINDWIVCQPNGGSLVTKKDGGMRCQNIKHVAPKCHNPPSRIYWISEGPTFNVWYYLFDGRTDSGCPAHNFCGFCGDEKKGVSNPGGTIYIR